MSEITYESSERLEFDEYMRFLRESDVGKMYPKRGFEERITRALGNAGVTITAREGGTLIGCCTGLTDFSYFLFLADLSVAKARTGKGIEEELVRRAIDAAGGPEDITVISWAMPESLPLYAGLGIVPQEGLIARDAPIKEWFNPSQSKG